MKFEIKMKDEVYDEVFTLMNNIDTLNKGDEIGGWLLGEWTNSEDTNVLVLDKFIIPKQTVSGAEVDIEPESMIDMLKEFGPEVCNRIKAHWHIHPFGKGDTNWSAIDEAKIKDFTEPIKGREIFVFLLSSKDKIKARVEVVIGSAIKGVSEEKVYLRHSMDNLPVTRENIKPNNEIYKMLEARIKEKVTQRTYSNHYQSGFWNRDCYGNKTTYTYKGGDYEDDDYDYWGQKVVKPATEPVNNNSFDSFKIWSMGKKIYANISEDFAQFILNREYGEDELKSPDRKFINSDKSMTFEWHLKTKGRVNEVYDLLEQMLWKAQLDFEEVYTALM